MKTDYINDKQLKLALDRNEAFWQGRLEDYPLLWFTIPNAIKGTPPAELNNEEQMWTDVEYVMKNAEYQISHAYYAADALPVYNPWLGPDQVAAWLGAALRIKPKQSTSWVTPFVSDWDKHKTLKIDKENRWWKLYLQIVKASVEVGRDKWITAYPDLHTGIDALSAIRGPENLLIDMIESPEKIKAAMNDMTRIFTDIVDIVSDIVLPAGQGTSNWTGGWSNKKFLCIGQNDFTCMISPRMFYEFCYEDIELTANFVDSSIYHLDGPDALRHLDKLLKIEKLNCIQWIQGSGNPSPTHWLELLKRIQKAGKSVQVQYYSHHGDDVDFFKEFEILCTELDPTRLFIAATCINSVDKANALVKHVQDLCVNR